VYPQKLLSSAYTGAKQGWAGTAALRNIGRSTEQKRNRMSLYPPSERWTSDELDSPPRRRLLKPSTKPPSASRAKPSAAAKANAGRNLPARPYPRTLEGDSSAETHRAALEEQAAAQVEASADVTSGDAGAPCKSFWHIGPGLKQTQSVKMA